MIKPGLHWKPEKSLTKALTTGKNYLEKCKFLPPFKKAVGIKDNDILEGTSQKALKILIPLSDIKISGDNIQKYFCSLKQSCIIKAFCKHNN